MHESCLLKPLGYVSPIQLETAMFNKILVVCVGNICRSPTGERVLQQLLPGKEIASAGIAAEKSRLLGKPADETAILIAAENGVDVENHQAQQVTPQLCAQYDLILVMEKGHLEALTQISPEARGKTMLFGQWICLLYTSPSPRDRQKSRMPSSA